MASTGASLDRRLERLEAALKARLQPQITVLRLIDEAPSAELKARDDVLVIQRALVDPPERPIEESLALPEPVTPPIDRPSRFERDLSAPPSPTELENMRFSRLLPEQKLGIV